MAGNGSAGTGNGGELPFPTVAIIGTGFGGLCMAIKLKEAGYNSFTIFERASRVGGTWRDNSYPGAACDIPSHLYSYSFEPKSDWTRGFPEQKEILEYIEHCVRKYGLEPHIQFNSEIESCSFDEQTGLWTVRTKGGEIHKAHALVAGTGQLNRPAYPKIKGIDSFEGTQFHSARWNHEHRLRGRSVAVIGTGASAIQFIPPVAEQAKQLYVFQRTPPYILEKPDRAFMEFEKSVFRKVPAVREFYRQRIYWSLETRFSALAQKSFLSDLVTHAAIQHLENQVKLPELRKKLTPDYPLGCKRILISNDFYPAMQRPNVELVTDSIDRITKNSIITKDGIEREVDTVIYGTGFQTTGFLAPMKITGLGGRDLNDTWRDGAEAYYGVTVTDFPNLFILYGPNTNLGHNSIIFMIECQVHYTMQCLKRLVSRRLKYLDPSPDAMRQYNEWVQRRHGKLVWSSGCESWYKNEAGKVTNNWPGYTVTYWRRTRRPDFGSYREVLQ